MNSREPGASASTPERGLAEIPLLASLNPQQIEAVRSTEGPLLLLAGAGSGKTRVLTTRIAYLIRDKGVDPAEILAVTFTNKAAKEMRGRVEWLLADLGADGYGPPTVCTFHAFCARTLRRHGAPLEKKRPGFTPDFLIVDAEDQLAMLEAGFHEVSGPLGELTSRGVQSAISRAKNSGVPVGRIRGRNGTETKFLNDLYRHYQDELLAANSLDFDDLLVEAVRLLRSFEAVRTTVRRGCRYLMVDEYQDTNPLQYDLVRLLAEPLRNVCVAGDEDQAIYSWRGADIGNILSFENDFPSAKIIRLKQNYRSTGSILAAASALIEHNLERKGKRLWTDAGHGSLPVVYRADDAKDEAAYIAATARRMLDEDPENRVGILYRANWQSRRIEDALRRKGLDFCTVGGVEFYKRAEVKDLLAYLRVAHAPSDVTSLRRIINVPARGIGKETVDRVAEHAASQGCALWSAAEDIVERGLLPVRARQSLEGFCGLMAELRRRVEVDDLPTVLQWVVESTGYKEMLEFDGRGDSGERIENVDELVAAASEASDRGETLREFLDPAALAADSDGIDWDARILLMTLHSAKGLEFPAVILAGLGEGLLPHQRSIEARDGRALEEERRLCYVGMTRAQRQLVLTCALRLGNQSRFLQEIPGHLLADAYPDGQDAEQPGKSLQAWGAARRAGTGRDMNQGGLQAHDRPEVDAGFSREPVVEGDAPPHSPRSDDPTPAVEPPPTGADAPSGPGGGSRGSLGMQRYKIFEHPDGRIEAVKQGWSWPAFNFPWIWALKKRMWVPGLGCLAAFSLSLIIKFAVSGSALALSWADALFVFVVMFAGVGFGLRGNAWWEAALERRGYCCQGVVTAESPEEAVAQFLHQPPDLVPVVGALPPSHSGSN